MAEKEGESWRHCLFEQISDIALLMFPSNLQACYWDKTTIKSAFVPGFWVMEGLGFVFSVKQQQWKACKLSVLWLQNLVYARVTEEPGVTDTKCVRAPSHIHHIICFSFRSLSTTATWPSWHRSSGAGRPTWVLLAGWLGKRNMFGMHEKQKGKIAEERKSRVEGGRGQQTFSLRNRNRTRPVIRPEHIWRKIHSISRNGNTKREVHLPSSFN